MITYWAGRRTSVEKKIFLNFSLSEGAYSIVDFNVNIKVAVSQQRQDWE